MALICQRCGGDLPATADDDELARLLQSGASITLVHAEGLCDGDGPPPAPEGRYFEVRVSIIEVTETEDRSITDPDDVLMVPHAEELASFVAGVRQPDLEAAMRPLALALGEKWVEVEKHARMADPKVGP